MNFIVLNEEEKQDLYVCDGLIHTFSYSHGELIVTLNNVMIPKQLHEKITYSENTVFELVYRGIKFLKLESIGNINFLIEYGNKPDSDQDILEFNGGWIYNCDNYLCWEIIADTIELRIL